MVDTCATFLDNRNRSRVIITTRNGDVAGLGMVKLKVKPLKIDAALEFSYRKKFWKDINNKICPQELEFCARKCDGLPLAIVVIGRFLSLIEQTEQAWKNINDNMCMEIVANSEFEGIGSILNLSFNDLPHHLENCFWFCAIFPEDHVINTRKLAHQALSLKRGLIWRRLLKTIL